MDSPCIEKRLLSLRNLLNTMGRSGGLLGVPERGRGVRRRGRKERRREGRELLLFEESSPSRKGFAVFFSTALPFPLRRDSRGGGRAVGCGGRNFNLGSISLFDYIAPPHSCALSRPSEPHVDAERSRRKLEQS